MKEQSRDDNCVQFIEVESEKEKNLLSQLAAEHALGRELTTDELVALMDWRSKRPELAVVDVPKPEVTFNFRWHFSNLSVTEIYTGDENPHPLNASLTFNLYSNCAILWFR